MDITAETIGRFERKLDRLTDQTTNSNERLARVETSISNYQEIQRQVQAQENRITAMESLEVAKIEQRLGKVENRLSKGVGWIAGATAVTVGVSGIILWYLNHVVDRLAPLLAR